MTPDLKHLLARHGITYAALAEALQISRGSVADLVNHGKWLRCRPAQDQARSVREALESRGVPMAEISAALMEAGQGGNPDRPGETSTEKDLDMLPAKAVLTQHARTHFRLFSDPFNDEVNGPEDLFLTPEAREVREAIYQAARTQSLTAIVGESGAGKTTLKDELIERVRGDRIEVVEVRATIGMEANDRRGKTLRAAQILEALLETLAPTERPRQTMEARYRQLHRVLCDSSRSGNKHLLVIDEAHCMPTPTLKHLKRFAELRDGLRRTLGILLIGQPELGLRLDERNPELREVTQRFMVFRLAPLTGNVSAYLRHKLARQGRDLKELIDDGGVEAIAARLTVHQPKAPGRRNALAMSYPLAVNNLTTAALNLAAELEEPTVTADVVKEA